MVAGNRIRGREDLTARGADGAARCMALLDDALALIGRAADCLDGEAGHAGRREQLTTSAERLRVLRVEIERVRATAGR